MIKDQDFDEISDFVLLLYARDATEAEFYRSLLEDHDIEAVAGKNSDAIDSPAQGCVPVLVPEEFLDEAQQIVEQRSSLDDDSEEEFAGSDSNSNSDDHAITELEPIDPDLKDVNNFESDHDNQTYHHHDDETDEDQYY